jgi:hypothetical protein
MTVTINRNSGDAPREVVEKLVTGQTYPFQATLKHSNTFPLVVPSTGSPNVIAPGAEVQVRIRNFAQAWELVTDLAQLASSANNDADDYAAITPAITPKPKPPRKPAAAGDVSAAQEGV